MSTGKPRDAVKERYWRQVVLQWRRSGRSVGTFCAERGLSAANFYFWRRTIAQRDAESVAFVPVRVVPEEKEADAGEGAGLELVLGAGRRLRIGPGFDGLTLRRLLAVLEEGRP